MDNDLAEKLDIIYWCFEPFTLKIGKGLIPLFKERENALLLKKMNELKEILGFDKIRVIDDKKDLEPLEYEFVSYGNVLIKETVTFEEATDKILQSLEKILISDDENILKWKSEIEEQEKNERILKPYTATIDGVKKESFTANELSGIFQNGGFGSILLDKNEKHKGTE
jgi:hypothetical protein